MYKANDASDEKNSIAQLKLSTISQLFKFREYRIQTVNNFEINELKTWSDFDGEVFFSNFGGF